MCEKCQHAGCKAESLPLCQGHLVALILESVAEYLRSSGRLLHRALEIEAEEQ